MYLISGKVIKGKQRGRDLGFPTANVLIDSEIPQGIYISQIKIIDILDSRLRGNDKKKGGIDKDSLDSEQARMTETYPSVTFIGNATTFGESDVKSETYILDFDQDLYDKMVEIELLEKIRENEKFESVEKLIENMNQDVEKAREYFDRK